VGFFITRPVRRDRPSRRDPLFSTITFVGNVPRAPRLKRTVWDGVHARRSADLVPALTRGERFGAGSVGRSSPEDRGARPPGGIGQGGGGGGAPSPGTREK
jgi:hypothetical protein